MGVSGTRALAGRLPVLLAVTGRGGQRRAVRLAALGAGLSGLVDDERFELARGATRG